MKTSHVAVAFLGLVALLLASSFVVGRELNVPEKNTRTHDALASGVERTLRISVGTVTPTQLIRASGELQDSVACVNTTANPAFVVESVSATSTNGRGPYCNDSTACPAGASFESPARVVFAIATGGTATLQCGFTYGAQHSGAGGGGAGGISQGAADLRYVRLSTTAGQTVDQVSAATAVFNVTNSGAGVAEIDVDGVAVATASTAVAKSGDTMVGQLVMSGVTTDIAAAASQELRLSGGSSSHAALISPDDTTTIHDATATAAHDFIIRTNIAAGGEMLDIGTSNGGRVFFGEAVNGAIHIGSKGTAGATDLDLAVDHGMGNLSGSGWLPDLRVYGAGLIQAANEQTCTCASQGGIGAGSCDIQSSNVVIVNNDPDGCVWTMDDATAAAISVSANSGGLFATISIKTNAGGVNTFPAVANKWRDGFLLCATTGLDLDDMMSVEYIDTADDFWGVTTCTAF